MWRGAGNMAAKGDGDDLVVEIHSPKLIGGVSEGGTEVFKLDYFGKEACLAQCMGKQSLVMSVSASCS